MKATSRWGWRSEQHWQTLWDLWDVHSVVPVQEDSLMSSAVNPLRPALTVRDSLPISLLKLPVVPPPPLPLTPVFPEKSCCPENPLFSPFVPLLAFQLFVTWVESDQMRKKWLKLAGCWCYRGISCLGEGPVWIQQKLCNTVHQGVAALMINNQGWIKAWSLSNPDNEGSTRLAAPTPWLSLWPESNSPAVC